MKTLLLKILHYIWFRRSNIYSIYKKLKANRNIKLDWKVSFKEFQEYINIYKESGLDIKQTLLDDKGIVSWDIVQDSILPNSSKRLVLNQQGGLECVPTALIRMINYNTNIVISEDKRKLYIADLKSYEY